MESNMYGFTKIAFTSTDRDKLAGFIGILKEFYNANKYSKDRSLYKFAKMILDKDDALTNNEELPKYDERSFLICLWDDGIAKIDDTYYSVAFVYDFPKPNEDLLDIIVKGRGIDYVYRTENFATELFVNTDTSYKIIPDRYAVEVYDGEEDDTYALYFTSKERLIESLNSMVKDDTIKLSETMSIRALNKVINNYLVGKDVIIYTFKPE